MLRSRLVDKMHFFPSLFASKERFISLNGDELIVLQSIHGCFYVSIALVFWGRWAMARRVGSLIIGVDDRVFRKLTVNLVGKRVSTSFVRKLWVVPSSGSSIISSVLRLLLSNVCIWSFCRSGLTLTSSLKLIHHVPRVTTVRAGISLSLLSA